MYQRCEMRMTGKEIRKRVQRYLCVCHSIYVCVSRHFFSDRHVTPHTQRYVATNDVVLKKSLDYLSIDALRYIYTCRFISAR